MDKNLKVGPQLLNFSFTFNKDDLIQKLPVVQMCVMFKWMDFIDHSLLTRIMKY